MVRQEESGVLSLGIRFQPLCTDTLFFYVRVCFVKEGTAHPEVKPVTSCKRAARTLTPDSSCRLTWGRGGGGREGVSDTQGQDN